MSKYSELRKVIMNYLTIASGILGAILSIIGLVGTFGPHSWLENRRISKALLAVGILLICLTLANFVLVSQQQDEKDMASAYAGVLQTGSTTLLSTKDRINAYPYLEIGDSGVAFSWSGPAGQSIFRIFEDMPLIILKERNGQIKISSNIRGQDGSIAVLENNEWIIPDQSYERNYNKNALEVKDKNYDTILQVVVLKDRIQIQGKFYDRYGNGVAIVGRKNWRGCVFEITGLNHLALNENIEPIFMNNSRLHFGELRKSLEVAPNLTAFYFDQTLIFHQAKNVNGTYFGGGEIFFENSQPKKLI